MGGAYAAGGELTGGSLNLAGRLLGLYPKACGPTTGPDDIEGMVFWGGWAWGLKPEASDPTTGPDAENGVAVGGGAAAKGEAVIGKFGRPGFSVPMVFNKTTLSARDDYTSIAKPARTNSRKVVKLLDIITKGSTAKLETHSTLAMLKCKQFS